MRYLSLLFLCLLLSAACVRAERIFELKGTTLVPVRYVADWVGATMTTNAGTKVTTLTYNKQVSTLKVGTPAITVAGKTTKLTVAPSEGKGILYAPLQAMGLAFGLKVSKGDDSSSWMPVAMLTNPKTGKTLKLPYSEENAETTPLHLDVYNGLTALITLHLARGMAIDSKDSEGRTPLMFAAATGDQAMVDFLLAKGASVKAESKYGETPLRLALQGENQDIARRFLDKGAPADTDTLALAAGAGATDIVRYLLDKGVSVNPEDEGFSNVPLKEAAEAGHLDIVDLLLAKGAKVDAAGSFGETPLLAAIEQGHADVIGRLLEKGANVNFVSKEADTSCSRGDGKLSLDFRIKQVSPILVAAEQGNLEVVAVLLKSGADVKQVNYDGLNALHFAAMSQNEDSAKVIEALADKGTAINAQPEDFKLDLSHESGQKPIKLRALSPLHLAVLFRSDEEDGIYRRVRALIGKGADAKAKTSNGFTVLHLAALHGADEDTLALLLKSGADVNAKTDDGLTSLKIATTYGEKDTAAWLRAHGGTE